MLSRVTSATVRGLLVALLVVAPSLLLPQVNPDTAEIVSLVALFAAALTIIEYASSYPSIVEFREAPPFNRIRFLSLFVSVLLISIVCRGPADGGFTGFVQGIGMMIGQAIDFPYSPVWLMMQIVSEETAPYRVELVRAAAGISYLISLISLCIFILVLRFAGWPRGLAGFNVWINLPTFDPTAGADVVERLNRDARINLAFGILLPFLIPLAVKAGAFLFEPLEFNSTHTLIWTIAAWGFLPSSLLMRGVAMARVADMIAERRRRREQENTGLVTA